MKYNKIKWLLFFWFWFSASVFVHAEDFFKVKERIIKETWIKIFSLYITPTLALTNFGYTSNIYSYQDIKEPDWAADMGINLGAAAILKDRFILMVNEYPYYSVYAKNKEEDAFNNKFQFALYTHVGRFNLNYRLNLDNIRERPNSEFGARTRHKRQSQVISIDYGKQNNFYVNFYAERAKREYTDEQYLHHYDLSHLDRDEIIMGIALYKCIFSRTRLSLRFEYYDYRFWNTSERNGNGGKASLGIDFPEISSITGTMRIGWNTFLPKNHEYNNYSKPFGFGSINIRMLRRFKFHFNYLVDNFFSFWNANQYFDEYSAAAGLEFYISGRLKIGYDYRKGNLIYRKLFDSSKTRTDDFYSSTFSLGVRIFRRMGIALTYTIYSMNSTQLNFTRKYNFIGGNIIHEF